MDLIFAQTKDRQQCSSETVVNGLKVRCSFSSSNIVTIPDGLQYFDGKLDSNENAPSATLSICKNHEMQLKIAFRKFSGTTS
jgi:hypothetical protein